MRVLLYCKYCHRFYKGYIREYRYSTCPRCSGYMSKARPVHIANFGSYVWSLKHRWCGIVGHRYHKIATLRTGVHCYECKCCGNQQIFVTKEAMECTTNMLTRI